MALASPASRSWDSYSLRDGTEIGDDSIENYGDTSSDNYDDNYGNNYGDNSSDEQDKMFVWSGFQPLYPSVVGPTYYAPAVGYPYVMNPMLNTMCTWSSGVMMPTMPVLQYPNPNVPMFAPQQPVIQQSIVQQSVVQQPYPQQQYPQQPNPQRPPYQPRPNRPVPNRPVPNPNFNPNNRPNHGPIRGQNQQPQGQNQQPQRNGNGGRPKFGNNHQGQDLGPKSFGDQIEDKYIPTVVNPYPAPIPGFYDQMGIPCNPYITYQQPIIVG